MRIKVTSPSFSKNLVLEKELKQHFPDSELNKEGIRFTKAQLKAFLRDCEGAIIGLESIDEDVLDACPNLKIISKYGVGLNNIDMKACQKRNVAIGWTGGVNKLSVAEMTLGFMLALSRNLFQSSYLLKDTVWRKNGGFQLTGKTVGIIGVGHVGKEVVRLLKPFECRTLVNDIIDQTDYYRQYDLQEVTKDEIFSSADIVTIHTPLTEQTRYLVNHRTLSQMKSDAFLINTARGRIVSQKDLKEALMDKKIAGAAIDVYEEEPPTDTEFLSLPNLICTPHIGGNALEAVLAMGRSAICHLREFFKV